MTWARPGEMPLPESFKPKPEEPGASEPLPVRFVSVYFGDGQEHIYTGENVSAAIYDGYLKISGYNSAGFKLLKGSDYTVTFAPGHWAAVGKGIMPKEEETK